VTLPDERIASLYEAERLLSDMSAAKDVPAKWRKEINYVLRHYPWPMYLDALRNDPPEIWK